jgi:uncharacterized protein YceH (UPF0502 family)
VNIVLNDVECRVLGALVEKDITTPDYYPLSMNALINACNQKSSREPVMNLDEGAVRAALASLQEKRLAGPTSTADSRVTKYEHRLQEVYNFTRGETAVLCVLLLRGPQTPGELRGRTERAHGFDSLEEVQSTLQRLAEREPPLVTMLPRQPGTKETRYMHMFSANQAAYWESPSSASAGVQVSSEDGERLARLEVEVENLKKETAELRQIFADFRRQFE